MDPQPATCQQQAEKEENSFESQGFWLVTFLLCNMYLQQAHNRSRWNGDKVPSKQTKTKKLKFMCVTTVGWLMGIVTS